VSDVPVIVITGNDDEADKARGLDLGADDYVTKPYGMVELQARIRAVLRRAEMPSTSQRRQKQTTYRIGALVMDLPVHTVTLHGKPVTLTPTEFRLLEHFFAHPGMVLSHSQLLTAVWGFEYSDATELLKPTISRLRQKIEQDPSHPEIVETVHGVGYRLVSERVPSPRR
jgi:two-component system, OmpR family, KDP operon response regulator KdpE